MRKARFWIGITGVTALFVCFQNCSSNFGGGPPPVQQASALNSGCLPLFQNNCTLGIGSSGELGGSCASGYTGSCQYDCSNGNWIALSNSCTPSAQLPVTCQPTTMSGCTLSTTNSGGSSGACPSGYSGSCSATCNSAGTWTLTSVSCTPPSAPPPQTYVCNFNQPQFTYGGSPPGILTTVSSVAACASFCESNLAAVCEFVDGGPNNIGCESFSAAAVAAQLATPYATGPIYGVTEASGTCGYQ